MKISLNKQYLLFLFFFYTLIFNDLLMKIIPLFQYEDEMIAMLALPLFVLRVASRKNLRSGMGSTPYIVGFIACSLLSSIYFLYQPFPEAAGPDLLLCMKFWLCIYTAKEIFGRFDIERFAGKVFFHVKLITWLFLVLTIINMAFGIFPSHDIRYGLNANMLFYEHPIFLVSSCSLLIFICFAMGAHVKGTFKYVGLLTLIMLTTLRSKALANGLVFIFLYYLMVARKKKFSLGMLLPLIPVVALVGWSQFEYYFITIGEGSARAQLLITGFKIANDHFPLGAGLGTYGSYYSSVNYSPLYYKYGLSTVFGMTEYNPMFICDSFWPMIMGQSGYFGTAFYIGAIVKLVQKISKLKNTSMYYYASGLAAMIYLIIDSTSSTAFVHPLSMPIALWIGILLSKISDNKPARKENDEKDSLHFQH